jgi:hypothetical protein
MNTRLNLTPSRVATASRVQLSPLTRRFTSRSKRPTVARINAPAIAARVPSIGSTLPRESAPFGPRFWSPDLLDRLQAPLTRYRD